MSKSNLSLKMNRTLHRTGLKLKKHSPEILVITGIVGMVASAVLACKATTKASTVIKETREDLDKIHEVAESKSEEECTTVDVKKATTLAYTKAGVKFIKLYGPSVALGAASITSILAGHNILRKRTAALAAAYTVTDKCFKEYRERVVERFGKDLDRELRYNIKSKEVEEIVVDENGNETVVKKTIDVAETPLSDRSEFAVFFDETCRGWSKDPEYNKKFLIDAQRFANDKLKENGILFLNEVYDLIGIDRTRAGQEVGWIYDEENPNGDNKVDFGIFDVHYMPSRRFVNGYERSILLDFNVDGYILDKM